jgi:hypothetical protein
MQQRVALDDAGRNGRIDATHEKHRLHAGLNMLVGVAKGVARRRASGRHHVAVSAKPETHRDFARNRAHGSARNAKQADLLDVSGVPETVLFLGKLLRASTRAENHADLALLREPHRGVVEPRIFERLGRGGDGQRHYAGNVLAFARIDPGEFLEIANLARDFHRQAAGVEATDPLDARFSCENRLGKGRVANAIGANDAHAGDDDAWKHASFNLIPVRADTLQAN